MDSIPKGDGDFITWLNNYSSKLSLHGTTVGVTAPEVTTMSSQISSWLSSFNTLMQSRAALKAQTASVRAAQDTLTTAVRRQAARIKTHPAYTEAIGDDLGIEATQDSWDPASFKPSFTATVIPGTVRLDFLKGHSQGVNIYCRLQQSMPWVFVARDTNSPYEDHTPLAVAGQPEIREYMLRALLNDAEIGLPSDIVSVTYGG